ISRDFDDLNVQTSGALDQLRYTRVTVMQQERPPTLPVESGQQSHDHLFSAAESRCVGEMDDSPRHLQRPLGLAAIRQPACRSLFAPHRERSEGPASKSNRAPDSSGTASYGTLVFQAT